MIQKNINLKKKYELLEIDLSSFQAIIRYIVYGLKCLIEINDC